MSTLDLFSPLNKSSDPGSGLSELSPRVANTTHQAEWATPVSMGSSGDTKRPSPDISRHFHTSMRARDTRLNQDTDMPTFTESFPNSSTFLAAKDSSTETTTEDDIHLPLSSNATSNNSLHSKVTHNSSINDTLTSDSTKLNRTFALTTEDFIGSNRSSRVTMQSFTGSNRTTPLLTGHADIDFNRTSAFTTGQYLESKNISTFTTGHYLNSNRTSAFTTEHANIESNRTSAFTTGNYLESNKISALATEYFMSSNTTSSALTTENVLEANRTSSITSPGQSTMNASVSSPWSGLSSVQTSDMFHPWTDGDYTRLGEDDGSTAVTPEVIAKVAVLGMICLAGSMGNLMVIWTVVKERNLHRPPFYFLLSLGVTDLSRAVFCLPVMMATVLHGSTWRHGESACELFAFATAFFVFSSALSLLAVAVDRHISMLHPRAYRRRSHGAANILAAVFIWIIAFSISFPPVVGAGRYVFVPAEAHCTFHHSHYSKNDSLSSAFVLIVILFLTFLLYFRIYRFLRAHRRMRPLAHVPAQSSTWAFVGQGANGQAFINWLNGFGGQAAVRQEGQRVVQRLNFGRVVNLSTVSNKNEHLTRLFLVITLVFLISWLPYCIVSLVRVFSSPPPPPSQPVRGSSASLAAVSPVAALVSSWLGYAQVAFCPVTFFLARGPAGRRRKISRSDYAFELAETERHEFLLENHIRK